MFYPNIWWSRIEKPSFRNFFSCFSILFHNPVDPFLALSNIYPPFLILCLPLSSQPNSHCSWGTQQPISVEALNITGIDCTDLSSHPGFWLALWLYKQLKYEQLHNHSELLFSLLVKWRKCLPYRVVCGKDWDRWYKAFSPVPSTQ